MYGVLFAYTPEVSLIPLTFIPSNQYLWYSFVQVFPAPHRGTGDAMASSSINRVTGILAPIIKIVTTTPTGAGSNGTANRCVSSNIFR